VVAGPDELEQAHDVNGTDGSSQTLAVAALADGFVSVGSHNGKPAAWVTSDGTTWRTIFLTALRTPSSTR